MVTSISAEEFQRFQSQLLDLREAQIIANDAKLRAEKRIKQLEEELIYTQSALTNAQTTFSDSNIHLEELKQENKLLRDKLFNTESSFQLQSSTLRAECYRLTNELDKLSQQLSSNHIDTTYTTNSSSSSRQDDEIQCSKSCQTIIITFHHKSIQTDNNDNTNQEIPTYLIEDIENLKNSLNQANSTHDKLKQTIEYLNHKVDDLETQLSLDILNYQQTIQKLTNENNTLLIDLNKSQDQYNHLVTIENELRNQIVIIKRRSEKLNYELRRQLSQFIRNQQQNGDIELSSFIKLRKNSLHSSSSSLSSNNNNHIISGTSATDGISNEVINDSIMNDKSSNVSMMKKNNSGGFHEMPQGFFSTADFKAIIDRMSEVQEENCTLRRCKKRLEADLMAKSRVIQKGLDNYLQSPLLYHGNNDSITVTTTSISTPAVSSSQYRSVPSNISPYTPTTISSSSSSSNFPNSTTWFPFLKNLTLTSDSSTLTSSSASLSSVNIQTVNRLKLMCEQLMTENIELKEKLQSVP
ncbi:putative ubiquitin-protein ligase BRE1 [Schistosoma mansoni]|uniref:putative ubiquitin-protein ligase BRE1 n=1 Tax=Schistosoma mansoni TaxID=6183 RepID=UPI0001A63532|nr:putative ubiquitin-protein ligase BRE1 [Schistosoma mansoni]|eukprot:XP_018652819.1 putative ubiquitin-protein ligase BRE1 [Schistosoma mansoni]